jgi:TfoX/Sxy family transcriptional regulator of competence genes
MLGPRLREDDLMATDASFAESVPDLAGLGDRLTCRKMFGEYGYHLDGVFIALACDNSLFLKHTPAIEAAGLDFPMRPPYPGAKPYPVIDELLDRNTSRLERLVSEPTPAVGSAWAKVGRPA